MTDALQRPALAAKPALLFLLLFAWCLAVRAPTFLVSVINWDESIYVLVASQWLDGHLPYSTVFDHKPVGIYVIFAAALALIGESLASIRLVTVLFVYLTSVALYFLARRLSGNDRSAALAAFSYPVFSLGLQGLSSNTEHFFICLNIAGLLLLLEAAADASRRRPLNGLLTGLCFGAAFQIKYIVLIEIALFLVYVFIAHRRTLRPVSGFSLAMAGGFLLPTLAVVGWYAAQDAFAQFYFANVEANRRYVGAGSPADYWNGFRHSTQDWIKWNWVTVAAILYAGTAARRAKSGFNPQPFLLLWLLFGFLESWVTLKFFKHYFLVTIPPLCLLFAHHAGRFAASGRRRAFAVMLAIVIGFPLARTVEKNYYAWITTYFSRGDANANIARHVRDRLRPGDYIYVVNGQPILYFLTGAGMPTRYVLPSHLIAESASEAFFIDFHAEMDAIFDKSPRVVLIREQTDNDSRVDEIRGRLLKEDYVSDTRIEDTIIYIRHKQRGIE